MRVRRYGRQSGRAYCRKPQVTGVLSLNVFVARPRSSMLPVHAPPLPRHAPSLEACVNRTIQHLRIFGHRGIR